MKAYYYFFIYSLPFSVVFSFAFHGYVCYLPLFIFFVFIPIIELFIKPEDSNMDKSVKKKAAKNALYDSILFSSVPIQLSILVFFLCKISSETLWSFDWFGYVSSMGLLCGVLGINVGHELGHREERWKQFLGEVLLLTSLNTHFLPYHNAGHHKNVATPYDAATARKGEWLFLFWVRSHYTSYYQAWELENKRMKLLHRSCFHLQNRMLIYTIISISFLICILLVWNTVSFVSFLCAAIFGILLLETVNYIEHYGLLRKKKGTRYERVKYCHSWNSNHLFGRLLLFNLSRHSDHHYNGSKPYQLLDSHESSPQMPTGYPGMMLLSLVPPLWFFIMHKQMESIENN